MPATPERAAFVAQEFRSATWESEGVRANYGRVARDTEDQPFETFFDDPLHAQAMANERGILLGSHARRFKVSIDALLLEDDIDFSQFVPSATIIDTELAADMTVAIAGIESADFEAERTVLALWGTFGPTPVSILAGQGAAAGTGEAEATGAAISIHSGAGAAAGTGTAAATGVKIEEAAGAAAGTGTAAGDGLGLGDSGDGDADGTGTAAGTGVELHVLQLDGENLQLDGEDLTLGA